MKAFYKVMTSTPFISELYKIANAYAHEGNNKYVTQCAEFKLWWDRILKKALVVLAMSIALFLVASMSDSVIVNELNLEQLSIDIFSNLIGFGIGVYALIFVLPTNLFDSIKDDDTDSEKIDIKIFNADMGYPLIVLAFAIVLSVILRFLPDTWVSELLSLFVLMYGMAMIFELIEFIFTVAQSSLSKRK